MGLDSFKTQQIHYKIDIDPHNTMEILYSFSRLNQYGKWHPNPSNEVLTEPELNSEGQSQG